MSDRQDEDKFDFKFSFINRGPMKTQMMVIPAL